jgi:sigma-E factor negative regulatory protein RseA
MAEEPVDKDQPRQLLSQLVDGELDAEGTRRACALWRDTASLRDDWHSYHLIGDVLRSDDLAVSPRHDEAFLAALRGRLAAEPVVLAPQPLQPSTATVARRRWYAPVAVAAGFMAVAGVLVVTRLAAPVQEPAAIALAPMSETAQALAAVAPEAQGDTTAGRELQLIRDARLDRYLAAHRQFGGDPFAVPGGSLRHAAVVVPER